MLSQLAILQSDSKWGIWFRLADCARKVAVITLLTFLNVSYAFSDSANLTLIAAGENRVVIDVNGDRLVLTKQNPEQGGVKLISILAGEVSVQHQGEILVLSTDANTNLIFDDGPKISTTAEGPLVIWATSNGFFLVDGKINDASTKFLVDTGADIVTLSSQLADQLGINYASGRDGFASTASGIAPLKTLRVNQISIGHITQFDVEISVIQGRFPEVALLGGSFLNQLKMYRAGNRMELSQN